MKEAGRAIEDEMTERLANAQQAWDRLGEKASNFRNQMVAGAFALVDDPDAGFSKRVAADGRREKSALGALSNPATTAEVEGNRVKLMERLAKAEQLTMNPERAAAVRDALAALDASAERLKVSEAKAVADKEAPERAKLAAEQAALDDRMLPQHTARLALTDQIAVSEAEIARMRSQMPAEDDASIEAARLRLNLGGRPRTAKGPRAYPKIDLIKA